jgi:glycosyltransferase involved in cell wall biosynthesis
MEPQRHHSNGQAPFGPPCRSDKSKNPELISVIIPSYCCAEYIAQAIESVLTQTFPAYEIIVVNDGSPDTEQLEAALSPFRDRIRYIKQPSRGPSGARNKGILEARGEYVACLDGDDYWAPSHLASHIELIRRNPGLQLVYCDSVLVKDNNPYARSFEIQPQCSKVTFDSLLVEDSAIVTSTAMFSRDAVLSAGLFDETFMRCEDFEMWLRMASNGTRIGFHSEASVFHRVNDSGLSADTMAMKKDRIRAYYKAQKFGPGAQQREVIGKLIATIENQCHVQEMKNALGAGDYQAAYNAGKRARALQGNWKLSVSLTALKVAPQLFRTLHRIRTWVIRDSAHVAAKDREILAYAGEDNNGARPRDADAHAISRETRTRDNIGSLA